MSKRQRLVACKKHGSQGIGLVCEHIAFAVDRGECVGFFWGDDTDTALPDAWCSECEVRVQKTGGEWEGEAEAHLGAKLLCGRCYDLAKKLNYGDKVNAGG